MSADNMKPTSRTNWELLQKMDDADVDYRDIPPLDADFFTRAHIVAFQSVQVDADILRWFRQHHSNYTEEINHILRHYIESQNQAA